MPYLVLCQGQCFSGIWKEERAQLKGTELEKLKKWAEEGLALKFVLMKPVLKEDGNVDIERLKTIYPVTLRLCEFLQELRVYDMDEMFTCIPTRFEKNSIDDWVLSNGSPVKSLFDECIEQAGFGFSQKDQLLYV